MTSRAYFLAMVIIIAAIIIWIGSYFNYFIPTDPPLGPKDYNPENPDCVTPP